MKLLNRIAVVTGAASGIGGRAAVRLAGEGAKLFLMDVNPDGLEATRSEILASGGEAVACPCDVSDEAAVKAAVMQAMDAYGRIDILVNVAGVQITKLLADTTKADYDKMMDINLGGTFLTMHEILPIMKKQGSGAIVNCASELAFVGYHELAVYTATKGAMISLSRSAALEAIPYGVRVNCVCPGVVRTNIWERALDDIRRQGGDAEAYFQSRLQDIPLKRAQTMEDVAHMFLYLSSDFADNMTGQSINITGGKIMH